LELLNRVKAPKAKTHKTMRIFPKNTDNLPYAFDYEQPSR